MVSYIVVKFLLWQLTAAQVMAASHVAKNPFERIDTHSHFVPPFWRDESVKYGYGMPDGMPGIPPWTEEAHLKMMRKANITKSILSITSPGTHLVPGDDALARNITRQCNEFAADLKRRHPDKFGFWASLPLPDVDGSLVEIDYALDTLKADGVAVLTNAHGLYLGNTVLNPIFEALNKRKATIFIHPTSPCIRHGDMSQPVAPLTQYPNPMFEFFFDTARAVVNMFVSGTIDRSPNVTIILSHAGGAVTPLVARFTQFATSILGLPVQISTISVRKAFQTQFFFDLAGFVFPEQIQGLLPYVNGTRILYGSDYPYTPESGVLELAENMNQELPQVFRDFRSQKAIYKENAMNILRT
ncbi:aminocarboxymuconate-semialdehyde decarboxylase [Trichoderma arundinaceum]|uniref:6-methylsalicylate decarboxylase n=1 Tax=Trichoderma arundinaceum TaxID=490622 RepID=A0A395NPX0_TRIAR|nr:aminocarboxymuconate-semialdehyde decarboxylase [Trichoderma arundinaceum]